MKVTEAAVGAAAATIMDAYSSPVVSRWKIRKALEAASPHIAEEAFLDVGRELAALGMKDAAALAFARARRDSACASGAVTGTGPRTQSP